MNPFGIVDHSAFAGFGVDLVWGLNADGEEVHIANAARGLACGLICPACKAPLIAKKGPKTAAHFSHQGKDSGCGSGRETNAHYWAKQLLIEKKQIWTPVVIAEVDGARRHVSDAQWMTFSDVRSERRLDRIVPDIVLTLANGRELIVEIHVTHPCGPEKIELIETRGWPAIEISLRHLRTCQDVAIIEDALLKVAPRIWLCNPKRNRAEDKLRHDLANASAKRAETARVKVKQERERLRREERATEADALDLIRAAADARSAGQLFIDPALAQLIEADEGALIGINTGGEGFIAPREVWQAILIDQFVRVADIRAYEDETFKLDQALASLESLIAPPFRKSPSDKVRRWIQHRHPGFRFPREAVESYLEALCMAGCLQAEGADEFGLPDEVAKDIRREQRRLIEIDRRAETMHSLLDQIITDLPVSETFDFQAQVWLRAPLAGSDKSPSQICEDGDAAYTDLISRLRALAKMAAGGGDLLDELLGLPLEAARHRAIEVRTGLQNREAVARAQHLRETASSVLAGEAQAWLTTPIEGGETPLAMTNSGTSGLHISLAALDAIGRRREAERIEAAAIAARRGKLQDFVKKSFPPEHRELATKNYLPKLGCSPWDSCRTDRDLENAIRILSAQIGIRARRR